MHKSALLAGRAFFDQYCSNRDISILDIGSLDINGSLRSVAPATAQYMGVDMAAGSGVDLVLEDPHHLPFDDQTFDAVVSTSCFEHDSFFWLTFLECIRVLRKGGLFYLNAPSNGKYHSHPRDHWRFYPDAGLALCAWAQRSGLTVTVVESFILNQIEDYWNDFVCVFEAGGDGPVGDGIYRRFPDATNVWLRGAEKVQREQVLSEDMRIRRRKWWQRWINA
jgi:SAM-dependent methyltransferase